MKKVDTKERPRRNVHIERPLYRLVSVEAAKNDVDKGKVIEEALKKYFRVED